MNTWDTDYFIVTNDRPVDSMKGSRC